MSTPTTPTTPAPKSCWCGCGGTTKSRFVPGHDARFHGWAKKVARGELDGATTRAALPHDEARVEFDRHVELEKPKAVAAAAAKATKAKEKADAAAAKLAAKATPPAAEPAGETPPAEQTTPEVLAV